MTKYWYCSRRQESRVNAITQGVGEQITILKESIHSHAPNQEKVNAELMTLSGEFQKEQADTAQLPLGQSVKTKSKQKWIRTNERIRNIVLDYNQYKEDNKTLDYLRCIGHNFSL
ncbi:hypothetical protein ANN_23736 [Periplaneta americana]|uniref:Uncharacterized protein n=1 Tax=Periplaneta americana TaxID=6978 RepID=A0ABQ8SLY0_PERAM|nr:hypothetical protein ANN_23736 [Periplaneta americana]